MKLTSVTSLLAIGFLAFVPPASSQEEVNHVLLIHDTDAILRICLPTSGLGCARRINFGDEQSYLVDPVGSVKKELQEAIDRQQAAGLVESPPMEVVGFFVEERGHFPNPTAIFKVFKLLHAEFPPPEPPSVEEVHGVLRNPSKPHKKIGICAAWLDEGYVRVNADANNLKKKHAYSALLTLTVDGVDEIKHLDATVAGGATHTFRYKGAFVALPQRISLNIRDHGTVNPKETDEEIIERITTQDAACDGNCPIVGECNMAIAIP